MSVEQTAQTSALFAHKQAKVSSFDGGEKKEKFAAYLKEKNAEQDLRIRAKAKALQPANAKPISDEPPRNDRVHELKVKKISYAPPENQDYQAIMDRMTHLANQNANQMSEQGRKRNAIEFEQLTQRLNDGLENSGHWPDVVNNMIKDHMNGLDISSKEGAAVAFNQLSNFDRYVDGMEGQDVSAPVYEDPLRSTLAELTHMANQSANHMSPEGRAENAKNFEAKMSEYLDMVEDQGLMHPAVMDYMRQSYEGLNTANPEEAAMAFNQLTNHMTYVNSLVA